MKAPRFAAWGLAAGAAAVMLAACGSSPSTTATTPPPKASSSPSSPTSSAGAAATITKNWETFFNGKTPVATRVSLLENGSSFPAAVLKPTALSSGASAKVLKVTNVTATTADVEYTIYLNGTPALANQHGTAVYENGTWKVGISSFCALLTAENSGNTSKDPSICRTG
jgi:hypothetical protein